MGLVLGVTVKRAEINRFKWNPSFHRCGSKRPPSCEWVSSAQIISIVWLGIMLLLLLLLLLYSGVVLSTYSSHASAAAAPRVCPACGGDCRCK